MGRQHQWGLPHLALWSKFILSDWSKVTQDTSGFRSPGPRLLPALSSGSVMTTKVLRALTLPPRQPGTQAFTLNGPPLPLSYQEKPSSEAPHAGFPSHWPRLVHMATPPSIISYLCTWHFQTHPALGVDQLRGRRTVVNSICQRREITFLRAMWSVTARQEIDEKHPHLSSGS